MIDWIAGLAAIAVIVSLLWATFGFIHANRPDRGNAENGANAGVKGILTGNNYAQGG